MCQVAVALLVFFNDGKEHHRNIIVSHRLITMEKSKMHPGQTWT